MKNKYECIKLIKVFNQSDLSLSQFCEENNISRSTFTKYRKIYNDEAISEEGLLNWVSVDLEEASETEIEETARIETKEDSSIEVNVKILTFKLNQSAFRETFSAMLKEIAQI